MNTDTMDHELRRMAEHYNSPAQVRAELEALRDRFPRLETKAQQDENRRDRATLNRLLLRLT